MIEMDEKNKRKAKRANGTQLLWIALLCGIILASCQRDNLSTNRLEIVAESISGGQTKMYVDDKVTYWEDGDKLLINGEEVTMHIDGSGNAYADLDSYNPENIYWGGTAKYVSNSYSYDLSYKLPHIYKYRTVTVDGNTYQKLDAPMVGYKRPSDDVLVLKHVTGVLIVNIQNNTGNPIVFDRITVSNEQNYKLCGSLFVISYRVDNVSPETSTNDEECSVIMDFGNGLMLTNGDNKTVQIPVRVAGVEGTPVKFRVKVEGHVNNTKYTFEQEQTSGGVLGRSVAGYVNVDVNLSGGHTSTGPLFSSIDGGDGRTYYQLYTPSDWRLMTQNASYNDNFVLMNDLDMEGVTTYTIPGIYEGHILGNNHTITNLTVLSSAGSEPTYMNCGLIEFGHNARVMDLTINGMTLKRREGSTASIPFGGAIASFVSQSLVIGNVHISGLKFDFGDVATTSFVLGGFIGDIQSNDVYINNSWVAFASGEVLNCSDEARIGGIASGRYSYSSIDHCTPTLNNVRVQFSNLVINQTSNAVTYFGGLLGQKKYANVTPTDCRVDGTVRINSNGTICKGKVYGDSSEIPAGIEVSGLTWN